MNVIQSPRPLIEDPISDATAMHMRGVWFGLLFVIPFWLLMAALALMML